MVYEVRLGKPNHPKPRLAIPSQDRRPALPQCIWTCRDGRQLLVGSDGVPLWERAGAGKPAKRADPNEFVVGICDRDPIYPPKTSPCTDPAVMRRCMKILADWKVAVTP
jgi:hypothetical protein